MTIDSVVQELETEKKLTLASRFPCRAIMVSSIAQYCQLIAALKRIPEIRIVQAEELFASADVMPRYENLQDSRYADQWLMLTGVSEYLRLFGKSEAETSRFGKLWRWMAPAVSTGRILIPLWGCEAQWHDKSLHLCEDVRQKEHYFDCTSEDDIDQKMKVTILSGEFERYFQQLSLFEGRTLVGLEEWYEYWMSPDSELNSFLLLTRRYATVAPTVGAISVEVIKDMLSFVRKYLTGGDVLTEDNCPKAAVTCLFPFAVKGMELEKAILGSLNMSSFSAMDAADKWENLSEGQRQLVFLWDMLHRQDNYFGYCLHRCNDMDELPEHILHDIFGVVSFHPEWVGEYKQFVAAIGVEKDDEFFASVDAIPDYEERLRFLAGKEKREQIYLLHMIGSWLRTDRSQVESCEELRSIYPELSAYLSENQYDVDLARYFSLYKAHKLENTLPQDEDFYFSGIQYDAYEYRYAVLSAYLDANTVVLWIDALGAEWLPLLNWSLCRSIKGNVIATHVVQASLPTETEFNNQWDKMDVPYEKLNKLDKLAHRGVIDEPDYYSCIAEQIQFVSSVRERVEKLLAEHRRVIVTGDHGTSRLAARFFHKRSGMDYPAGAEVCSHGRYCRLNPGSVVLDPNLVRAKVLGGDEYAVYRNYDHFRKSGFAAAGDDENALYGEVHGGATPEEVLVPVLVFDSNVAVVVKGNWENSKIKIKNKKACAQLNLNLPINVITAKIGEKEAFCTATQDRKKWFLEFSGVKAGTYDLTVIADGTMLQLPPLNLTSPLGEGDGDLL